ncbi:glutamic acid-rich protein-like isoform X1 [Diaphorina citri]|uniref:Glutamic acid-rich protein-like isoform X1 n=2 Tax=Diaphorina citri TaxID=121845 RepID=A0A3Q0J799_DIACI|nr:glutamic acid-rich protein-like isoform X1 [Diaphorina citri]
MINRDFIKSNSMESIKQPKERKLEKSIKVNSQDCKICRAIKEKNMKRNKTRPKCEHCMSCKVKKNNDIGKPEKEYSNNKMSKKVLNRNYYCSSSNDNEVGEKKCLPKQRPTTCHPEECIRKIKELLQSIEPSTSSKGYQMCREQNDMRKRKRDHDECEKSHQVNTKRKNPENNRRSHEDDKDTQTRGSCKKPHNPDKSGNRKCSDTEILTKPSKSKGKGKSKTAKKKKKDTSKGKCQKDLKIKSKVHEEETSKKCNHDKNRKESREKKDRRSNCDTNEDIEHCESDDNDQDTNSDDDDLEETEQNDEQDMDNGTEDEELNEYKNNEEELLNNEDEEDDDDADLETPETENTSDVDEASDCENSDKTLSIVKRILNKLGFKNRSFVDVDTVKRSSPDLTILALLIIILIILAVIFVTVRIFNRKHDIAIDSQGEFQVVKMDIGQKYETCLCCNPQSHANHNVQQLYFCREKMNDPNTGSFSTVLKALYLPDQNSYQKLSQTSLYSSLTPELNDEEKCARKILHGKRHIKSSNDLHKSKK